jgi:peroxiredoxin
MPIQVGDKIPEMTLKIPVSESVSDITTDEIFSGKKVVLFAVPGAFTPLCSAQHLPGYVARAGEIKARGVDAIVCVSVNDAFVMGAWGREQGAGDEILMVADGNGDFARAIGLDFDGSKFGMGVRFQRFAAIVEDGIVKTLNVERPMRFDVSDAETILGLL